MQRPQYFHDRVVMITGASGNLGRAVAQSFAQAGAKLVLVDLDASRLAQAYGKDDESRLLVAANLLDSNAATSAVTAATGRFGRIDVLCNIAGGFRMGSPVHATPDEDWNFLFDINARTVLHTARAVVPQMLQQGGGKIVSIAANSALKGVAQMGAYCASKDVVIRMTESMAAELRDSNINVNCVLPSIIDTPENRSAMPDADPAKWVAPDALADAILFLASDAARAIHGAALPVTGRS